MVAGRMKTFWNIALVVMGFVVLDLLLAAGLIFFAWKYVAPYESHKMVRLAEPLVLKRQYAQARQYYDWAVLLAPYDTATRYERGLMNWHLGQNAKALADMNPYVEAHPTNTRALVQRGLVKANLRDWSGAIEDYDAALAVKPDIFDALKNRAYAKSWEKDNRGALADYSAALELNRNDYWTLAQRSYVRILLKDYDGAIDDSNKALDNYPHYILALEDRGWARSAKGDDAGALEDFDQAIKINPTALNYQARGTIKIQQDNLDGAITDLNRAIKLNPQYYRAYYMRGVALRREGELMLSEQDFTKALEIKPSSFEVHFARGMARYILGKSDEAEADWRECLTGDTNYRPYGEFWLWILKSEQGKKPAADKELADFMTGYEKVQPGKWENFVGNFLLGKMSADDLVAHAQADQSGREHEKSQHLCEAWFYAGKAAQIHGDAAAARRDFTNAIATGIKDRVEYSEARRELAKL